MKFAVQYRRKGNPASGLVHETLVQNAESFADALEQAKPHPPNTTWSRIINEDTGEQITLRQVRSGEKRF